MHFQIVIGGWKFENWHLYRWCQHVGAKNPAIRWWMWDRVF